MAKHRFKKLLGKKAEELGLREVIELLLVIGVVLLAISVIGGLFSLILSDDSDIQSTKENFYRLVDSMRAMLSDKSTPIAYKIQPYFIGNEYGIVSFDYDFSLAKILGTVQAQEGVSGPILRPSVCGNKACICLYKQDIAENNPLDENIIDCARFDEDIKFYAHYDKATSPRICGTKKSTGKQYKMGNNLFDKEVLSYFVILGDKCGTWNAQQLYSEMVYVDRYDPDSINPDRVDFYFSIYDDDRTLNRISVLSDLVYTARYVLSDEEKALVSSETSKKTTYTEVKNILSGMKNINKHITPELLTSLILKESSNNPLAISFSGAAGLAQFTSKTAKEYSEPKYEGAFRKDRITPCGCASGSTWSTGCIKPKCTPLNDDRFDKIRSIKALIYYLNNLFKYDFSGNNKELTDIAYFALSAYNGGATIISAAVKNAMNIYSTQNPRWSKVAAEITPQLIKGTYSESTIRRFFNTEKKLKNKVKEIITYAPSIIAFEKSIEDNLP